MFNLDENDISHDVNNHIIFKLASSLKPDHKFAKIIYDVLKSEISEEDFNLPSEEEETEAGKTPPKAGKKKNENSVSRADWKYLQNYFKNKVKERKNPFLDFPDTLSKNLDSPMLML